MQEVSIPQGKECTAGHIAVRHLAEQRGRTPGLAVKNRLQHHHLAAGLGIGREPDGQQTAARQPGHRRLVVMGIERSTVLRSNYIRDGFGKMHLLVCILGRFRIREPGFIVRVCVGGRFCIRRLHYAEAQQHGTVSLERAAAVGAAQKLNGRIVAAAANGFGIIIVIIAAPLLYIAVHIVQAPRIGLELGHLQRHRLLETGVFLHFPLILRESIARIISGSGTCAAGVLPFGLGGKAEVSARLFRQPVAVRGSLYPGDHHHRLVIGLRKALMPAQLLVGGVKRLVLGVGDFRGAHPESGKSHFLKRGLVPLRHGWILTSHHKASGRNFHHGGHRNLGTSGQNSQTEEECGLFHTSKIRNIPQK